MTKYLADRVFTEEILSNQDIERSEYEKFVRCIDDRVPNEAAWLRLMHWSRLYASDHEQMYLANAAMRVISTPAIWLNFIDLRRGSDDGSELLADAYEQTKYHYADNSLWHRLKELVIEKEDVYAVQKLYLERLAIPHSDLDETLSEYSQFVTTNFSEEYDEKMANAMRIVSKAKAIVNKRDFHETKLSKEAVDEDEFVKYLRWASRQKLVDHRQLLALHERAIAQCPWFEPFWLGYLGMVKGDQFETLAHRALLACPKGPKIWQKYVKQCDLAPSSTEAQKLLALTGPEIENAKVTYYEKVPSDQRSDVAKRIAMGQGSCEFHTLKSIVKELNSRGQFSISLDIIDSKMPSGGDRFVRSVDFWQLLVETLTAISPQHAAKVPDKLTDILLRYPDLEENLDEAAVEFVSDICELELPPDQREQKTANVSSGASPNAERSTSDNSQLLDVNDHRIKRPGEQDGPESQESASKRRKVENAHPKRDREHLQVTVSDLPENCSAQDIRDLFHDCGEVVDVKISDRIATAEFKEREDCLAALTKDHKRIGNTEIRVSSAELATLWVTNFPPGYTRDDLTLLFSPYGHILDIRIPSQHVKARRFCYVQLASSAEAEAAAQALHSKKLDNHELIVKISDPMRRQARTDDADLVVKKIDFTATESDIRNLFSQFGTIEKLKLPNNHKGENKFHDGYAFVTMGTASEAHKCIEELDGTKFKRYDLQVSLASNKKRENVPLRKNARQDMSKTVKVFNVSDSASDVDIRQAFEKQGKVVSVNRNRSNNTATVEFEDTKQSGKAELALEGTVIGGTAISFTAPRSRPTMFVPRSARRK